ncbi:hypothetical protein NSS64_32450 [Paenibacillus sp. FSL H8-0122]|uniref:hypothetical protein n=1 Tax=Paenibacillus sp. FSL H8-0122 TaxID=2954510 RepID=UPI0030F9D63C
MTWYAYQVRDALKAGHRHFNLHSGAVAEVLKYGDSWVRYKTPAMSLFLSTNMRGFGYSVESIHIPVDKEKSPDSASGQ